MVFEMGLGGDRAPHETLSEREFQIFEMLVNGQSVTDIAEHLNISAKTVSTHKIRLMQKLGANSRPIWCAMRWSESYSNRACR